MCPDRVKECGQGASIRCLSTCALSSVILLAGLGGCGTTGDPLPWVSSSAGSQDAAVDSSPPPDAANPKDASDSGNHALDTGSLGDGTLTEDAACAAAHVEATQLPLDLYIMADRSGSMSTMYGWKNQRDALVSFFDDPQSLGLHVALNLFPLGLEESPSDPTCSGGDYVNPLVPWGELTAPGQGHSLTLAQALDISSPDGRYTPTQDALNGVLYGARKRQLAEPSHVVAAVVVSDGEPCCHDCPLEGLELGQVAADFLVGTPPIRTFAIYVSGGASAVMNSIAQQGGTTHAYDATSGAQAFLDALVDIRKVAMACSYELPKSDGGTVDPAQVSVQLQLSEQSEPLQVPKVANSQQCAGQHGWFYDSPTDPQRIILCPASCDTLQADHNAKVDILVGCQGPLT